MKTVQKSFYVAILASIMFIATGCGKSGNSQNAGGGSVVPGNGYYNGVVQYNANGTATINFVGTNNYDSGAEIAGGQVDIVSQSMTTVANGYIRVCPKYYTTASACWDFINNVKNSGTTSVGGAGVSGYSQGYYGSGNTRTIYAPSKVDASSGLMMSETFVGVGVANVTGSIILSQSFIASTWGSALPSVVKVVYNLSTTSNQIVGGGVVIYAPNGVTQGAFLRL